MGTTNNFVGLYFNYVRGNLQKEAHQVHDNLTNDTSVPAGALFLILNLFKDQRHKGVF